MTTTAAVSTLRPLSQQVGLTPARRVLASAPLVLGSLGVIGVLIVKPWGERNQFGYEHVQPLRDEIWTGALVDGVAMAAVGFGLALVACSLARTRGARWADVGGAMTAIGGVLFAMGIFAFGTLAWYATDTAALAAPEGAALLTEVVDNPAHAMVVQTAGYLTFTLGLLVAAVALLRAGTISRWLPIAIIVTTLAAMAPMPDRVLDGVQIVQLAVLAVIGIIHARSPR